tara:strand:- start:127 stop:276 length:150 start_codon:yes stop_codon:yes gene_type:complete
MSYQETKKSSKKDEDQEFIDTLKEMKGDKHKDEAWNEKFKQVVFTYFDL